MDAWREKLEAYRQRWRDTAPRTRALVLASAGVIATVVALLWVSGSTPDMAVLYSDLSQQDAARIVERLRAMNVEYELADGGATIRVPQESVYETRLTLANEGLPSGGGVGFEIFDTQRFGESDFSEQVQFRRALEGELARTIGHLAGVQSARVHLVLPERTLFTTDERNASASVALHLVPGWRLRPEQVSGVSHLVASSVPGLSPEDVTVVDGNGRPLHGVSDGEGQGGADVQELRSRIESDRQRAVQELLDVSLGPGAALVRVSADIDTSREEHLEETYDPERIATRSFELEEELAATPERDAQGVPGAVSNLPGGSAAEGGDGLSSVGRRSERRNYEVTKTVRRAVRPVGRLSRLTVAVIVDGHWSGEGAEREFTPRDEEELRRIRALVATAAGVSEERGDVVTVECIPFAPNPAEQAAEPRDPLAAYGQTLPFAAAALGVLVFVVLLLIVWRARRRRRKAEEEDAAAEAARLEAGSAEALPSPADTTELLGDGPQEAPEGAPEFEELHTLVLEVAKRDPELAARVVSGWLAEDASGAPEREAA